MSSSSVQESEVAVEEPTPPPARRRRKALVALALVALVVLAIAGIWVARLVNPGAPGPEVVVDVPRGASSGEIASLLEDKGVLGNASVFNFFVKVNGGGQWQAGQYRFHQHSGLREAMNVLDAGPSSRDLRLTIPEGFTLEQVAERVGALPGRSRRQFLAVAGSGTVRSRYQPSGTTNLEGLLSPDSYAVGQTDDEAKILRRMVNAFDARADQLGLSAAARRLGLSPYQVVTVASMIERETRVADDRAKVARVVYNRLAQGWRLGIDATTRYELHRPSGPLHQSELERDSPYNTRTRTGLPPTPIACPGRESLRAAIDPAPGPWMYYVLSDSEGRHAFAATDEEFQRARAEAKAKGLL